MAESYRTKGSALSSAKAIYGAKEKATRLTASKNQQTPETPLLPRIDRRGEAPSKPHVSHAQRNGGLPISLPPQRPSSKENEDSSPTYHGDELVGPSAKAAWCTPRAPDIATGSHIASFFGAPEEGDECDESTAGAPTPLRLQSVEDSINANEERYRVDMEQLSANNDKFMEITTSANQHLEYMHSQLPCIAETFVETANALQNLSADIETLHQQHEIAKQDMYDYSFWCDRFDVAVTNNAEEMVALSASHANDRAKLLETHERELFDAKSMFREKVADLEEKYRDIEKAYMDELMDLRQTSALKLQELQEKSRSEKEAAQTTIEQLKRKANDQLEELQTRTQSEYKEFKEHSQAEYAALKQTSSEELSAVHDTLTMEITALKKSSAAELAALTDNFEQELHMLREQHDEALHSLKAEYLKEHVDLEERAAQKNARLEMFAIDQSTQMEARRCRETKSLRDALQTMQTDYSSQIRSLHHRYTSQFEAFKATSESEKVSLLKAHTTETERIREAAALQLSQIITSRDDVLRSAAETHSAEMARATEEAILSKNALVAKYEADMASRQNKLKRELDELVLQYEAELDAVRRANASEHENTVNLHEAQIAQLREAHAAKVLALEMTIREKSKQAQESIRDKDLELKERQERIESLETSECSLREFHVQFAERSQELIEQKNMAMSELDNEIWRLSQSNQEKDSLLESTNRELKAATEDLQVKANTILELTFVIKSRDDEIDKLRNALLDTVQTVNTKTEILELTTETLSSKAKELEAAQKALRLESGRLSMVEQSMHQKEGLLEDTELKMESMRLNMENMRLELKRMQMDMKLQLEHTEGEIELKNGEIRRLHGAHSDFKQKNDFFRQTIERLEKSLSFAQGQGEEAQRRIDLLKLEGVHAADEMKTLRDQLLAREHDLTITTRESQAVSSELQRLKIEFNNLAHLAQLQREKIELHTMHAEEVRSHGQQQLRKIMADKDERMRSEKNLLMLELSSAKDTLRHLEDVKEQLRSSTRTVEVLSSEKRLLEVEILDLNDSLRKYENTERSLHGAEETIKLNAEALEDKMQLLQELDDELQKTKEDSIHSFNVSRMEIEDSLSSTYAIMCSRDEAILRTDQLKSSISNLREEKEQEKREIVTRADNLQEKLAGMRAEGARAANNLNELQHALNEKKKEVTYLQENLARQTVETRHVKTSLDSLLKSNEALQRNLENVSHQREQETQAFQDSVCWLEQSLGGKVTECEALQKAVEVQRQEHRQLLDDLRSNHDSHATQLIADYHNQIAQLSEDSRNQVTQLTEDHRRHLTQLTGDHRSQVARLTEDHRRQIARLAEDHRVQVAQLTDERSKLATEITQLKVEHLAQLVQLTGDRDNQVDKLTEDLRSQVSQIVEGHRNTITRLEEAHRREIEKQEESHRTQNARLEEVHITQVCEMEEYHRNEIARLEEDGKNQVDHLKSGRDSEVSWLKENHHIEVAKLTSAHQSEIAQLKDHYSSEITRLGEERQDEATRMSERHRCEVARLADEHCSDITQLTAEHKAEVSLLTEEHRNEVERLSESYQREIDQLKDDHLGELARLAKNYQLKTAHLNESHQDELTRLTRDYTSQLAQQEGVHQNSITKIEEDHSREVNQLIEAHRSYMDQLRVEQFDGFVLPRAEYEGKLTEIDTTFAEVSNNERFVFQSVNRKDQYLQSQHQSPALGQQQGLLQHAASERIHVVCTHALELVTLQVIHQHEIASLEEHATESKEAYSRQLAELRSQISRSQEEHAQMIQTTVTRQSADTDEHALKASTKPVDDQAADFDQAMELVETTKARHSNEQFITLIRQQLGIHMMEVHRIDLNGLDEFVLRDENDLLACLKCFFAMLCCHGATKSTHEGAGAITSVDSVRSRLEEYDRIAAVLEPTGNTNTSISISLSKRVGALKVELARISDSVSRLFVSPSQDGVNADDGTTDSWVELLIHLGGLFEVLRLPSDLENALVRSRQLTGILHDSQKLMADAQESSLKDEIRSLGDVRRLFRVMDKVLNRVRQVTHSDHLCSFDDFVPLFDEWEGFDQLIDTMSNTIGESALPNCSDSLTEDYLRSSEFLHSRQESAAFIQRCKSALHLTHDESSLDDIVESINQLMKILQHFELLQPKLGSPRRPSSATTDPAPTIETKVAAVIAFVEELQLMADFAQNLLDDDSRVSEDPASNKSSRSSLEALRVLTRTPSPGQTLDELQIEVELSAEDALDEYEANHCEFSNDEGDRQHGEFFSRGGDRLSPCAPLPFLADSLMDISLVMNDHQRLLSEATRWVVKSREGKQKFSLGSEISRLVREHCALLSLARRLFRMKYPRQELVSLLEAVALLDRVTSRLAVFGPNPSQDQDSCFGDALAGGSSPSESATSLDKSEIGSTELPSRPILAFIGDAARHLQDYDYFLRRIQTEAGQSDPDDSPPVPINIEELVQELNDQVALVGQMKSLLGLKTPKTELPQFIVGAQEVLRQAKQLRHTSNWETVAAEVDQLDTIAMNNEHHSKGVTGSGGGSFEHILGDMDTVMEDLRRYNDMLSLLRRALPLPETEQAEDDLKQRLVSMLVDMERLGSDNILLAMDKARLEGDLALVERSRDGLVEQFSKEDELLGELTSLQATALETSAQEAPIRLEVLKTLIENQKSFCNQAEHRNADERAEVVFLEQHGLLSEQINSENTSQGAVLSVNTRIAIYRQLLERMETLRLDRSAVEKEKGAVEDTLTTAFRQQTVKLKCVEEELAKARQEMASASAEEKEFLSSKCSSFLDVGMMEDTSFSRVLVYRQLVNEITRLLDEKHAGEASGAQEYAFLQTNKLLSRINEDNYYDAVPSPSVLSSIRLKVFQQFVAVLASQQQQLDSLWQDLSQESEFVQSNGFVFDVSEPHKSRMAVYETLLAGQNTLIEEKMEREVALASEKAFLASHHVPAFETPMEICEQVVSLRKQLDDLAEQQKEEVKFLSENKLCPDGLLASDVVSLNAPFSSSHRLSVYRKLLETEERSRVEKQLQQEEMKQHLSQQAAAADITISSLARKIERLETTLMGWHETAFASQEEWDRLLQQEEENRRSLIRYFEDDRKQADKLHIQELEKIAKARDDAMTLATATHAEALGQVSKSHEQQLAAELHRQAQRLELAAFAHKEQESQKQTIDPSSATTLSVAHTRAQLLEKFAKRDTAAISMVYRAIRLATDILSSTTSTSTSTATTTGRSGEISTDATQAVLSCVKELKALKEYLVQSLEHATKDDDQTPPPFAQAPFAQWVADAVARATADKDSAIDLALCSHREFMTFAQVQLLTRQDEAEKALARLYEKLKLAATNGGFTAEQEKLLALEMEVTREKEAKDNVACKFRLNEEYYRRLLDERKEIEVAQAATVTELRDNNKLLRLRLENLEQQLQQQHFSAQSRPPSSASTPRSSVVSPRVLKSAAISTAPIPMRPERPRGGSVHKERYVSDLEKETGQRHTNGIARRIPNDRKDQGDVFAGDLSSQPQQDFQSLQAAAALERVVPALVAAPATAPGSSLQTQEMWYQGVRSIQYVSFFISVFHVPRQQLFRVEVFNSDTEQQQQTVYVTWTEMQTFLQESRKAVCLGLTLATDPELATTVPQNVRVEVIDILLERVKVFGEGTDSKLLGFE